MSATVQIAKHLRDVHFGGNWTSVNFKAVIADITWEQAIHQVESCNTIATLVYHATYYVTAVRGVLEGGPLDAKDEYSFHHPPIMTQQDWLAMQDTAWENAERTACLIEQLPDSRLEEPFADGKYGTWYRNLAGMVEHLHYHLGQIVILKKQIQQSAW